MANKFDDLTGRRFERLTVIKRVPNLKNSRVTRWLCKCDCGNYTEVNRNNLLHKKCQSCGCLARDIITGNKYRETHNMSRTRLYYIWQGMKQRCLGQGTGSKYYNGRGITYCPEWESFESFRDWALSNGYSKNLTLDRKDVDGDYEPSNCRWISTKQQNRNKTSTIFLTLNGEAHSMGEWSEILGIPMSTMVNRRNRGLSVEQILSTKYLGHKKKRWGVDIG
jgi:hypothetical protein